MHRFQIDGFGAPLALHHHDRPEPGPGEVVVKMTAAALNYRDLLVKAGTYNPKFRLPLVPVSDGAGEVVSVGPGASALALGDRVTLTYMENWPSGPLTDAARSATLGGPVDGVLTEYRAVRAENLVRTPAHLSDLEAACFPCAGVTAWAALAVHCRVKPGDWVLVQGTGGVSLFALQFAKAFGARVAITSSNDDKLERARALGADHTVNYRDEPEWGKAVRKATGGVDHVIEVGGAGTLEQSLAAVRTAGTIALIGVLSGVRQPVAVTSILMRGIRVQGIAVGSRADMLDMFRAVEAHRIAPVIGDRFDFDQAPAALDRLATAQHVGKIVIGF